MPVVRKIGGKLVPRGKIGTVAPSLRRKLEAGRRSVSNQSNLNNNSSSKTSKSISNNSRSSSRSVQVKTKASNLKSSVSKVNQAVKRTMQLKREKGYVGVARAVQQARRLRSQSRINKSNERPLSSERKITVAVPVGKNRMQDAVVTVRNGKVQSTKLIGSSIPQSKRFKSMGRDKKTTQQIVNDMLR